MNAALQLPVFTVGNWSGNAVDDSGVEWWVTGEDGWSDGPDVRLDLVDHPQRHGAFDARSFRGPRVITLEGTAVAPDQAAKEQAKDRVAAVLADGDVLGELTVHERARTRRALVRLAAGTKLADTSPYTFDWSLQLVAPDPLRYSGTEHRLSTGLAQHGKGLVFPLRFPLALSEPTGGRITLANAGTVPTPPVWEIAGPCSRPVIEKVAGGGASERLAFDISLADAQVLVVDVEARTVLLGGEVSRRSSLLPRSRWFSLPVGRSEVAFEAWTFDEGARLTARWRDAWI